MPGVTTWGHLSLSVFVRCSFVSGMWVSEGELAARVSYQLCGGEGGARCVAVRGAVL